MRLMALCLSVFCIPLARADGDASLAAPYDPTQHVEVDYESGVLWRITGSGTPLTYSILPQIISIKGPLNGDPRVYSWGVLVLRNRFSFLYEPIAIGPEHHFVGGTASGILEWWDTRRKHALFLSSGGGLGWLDSKGHQIKGAQGEDFNFTWFVYSGVRFLIRKKMTASAGVYFQHISNHNLDQINPGINAVGPMLSIGWHF
jgi:lipid A 3-O-deacylase